MIRQPVTSSFISSIGHDGGVLEVEFTNGKVFRYAGVSPETYQALVTAPSIGRHFGAHIRGKFVAPDPEPAA
jgi:hypothetical protein